MQVIKIFHSRKIVLRDITRGNIARVRVGAGTAVWTLLDYGNSQALTEKSSSQSIDNKSGQAVDKFIFPCRQASPEVSGAVNRLRVRTRESRHVHVKELLYLSLIHI